MTVFFTQHSLLRFQDRLVSKLDDVGAILSDAISTGYYHEYAPEWYYSRNYIQPADSLRWVFFKDADGIEAAGLVDINTGDVVTLVKKNV